MLREHGRGCIGSPLVSSRVQTSPEDIYVIDNGAPDRRSGGQAPWRRETRQACLRLMSEGQLRLDHLITHVVPYSDAQAIFEMMLRTASGERTKSEQFDFGAAEFAPWVLGATM